MTKWSGVTPNSAPALVDYLMGVTSTNVDDRVTIQAILNLLFANSPSGTVVGEAISQTGAVATGTTVIPGDDTIPQNTEGDQYLSITYTPKAATNHLFIEVKLQVSASLGACDIIGALFQDANVNALASGWQTQANTTYKNILIFGFDVVAGSTAATTFKVRAGIQTAGTITLNGNGGSRLLGGSLLSYIKVTEYRA